MTLRLITFDLDDTLWDVAAVMNTAETTLRAWLAENAPQLGPLPIEQLWAIRQRVMAQDPSLKHRMSELRRRILLQAMLGADYAEPAASQLAEEAFQVFLHARHQVEFFDGVHETLDSLAQRYQLAVITNGNADVHRLGLGGYFQHVLCAEELGVGKPDPLPFLRALQLSGVNAEQALHIGDHPVDDILGAQRAGLHTVWFNPQSKPWGLPDARPGILSTGLHQYDELPKDQGPSAEIQHLKQLADVVASF